MAITKVFKSTPLFRKKGQKGLKDEEGGKNLGSSGFFFFSELTIFEIGYF